MGITYKEDAVEMILEAILDASKAIYIAPQVSAYIEFTNEKRPEWLAMEKAMDMSGPLPYAGTIDRVGKIGRETWPINLKVQEQIKKLLTVAQ